MNGTQTRLMEALSEQIVTDLEWLGGEQSHPGMDADKSDDEIKERKLRVMRLRQMRDELEVLLTGAML